MNKYDRLHFVSYFKPKETGIFKISQADVKLETYHLTKLGTYILDTSFVNYLRIIKMDTTEKIIAGRFSFLALDTNTNDTVYVNEGRFDANIFLFQK